MRKLKKNHFIGILYQKAFKVNTIFLLKAKIRSLLFSGCISTAGPVAFGSPQDVIDNVKETLEIMMPGGGYCFVPTHSLQDNSPTENVVAMYEAVHKYGRYK